MVLTAATLGEVSTDSLESMLWILGNGGSLRLDRVVTLSSAEEDLGAGDVEVNVVLVFVVDVVGVAFEILKAK